MSQEVEAIKAKVDLVELVGEYVKLTPAGANFRAPCPFHHEKTPSFMVNRAKQIWKCFGCGEGGDIFTFLMKIEGLEFPEALKVLAQRAGVALSGYRSQADNQKNRLHDLCDLAARYWHKVLIDSPAAAIARDYLAGRQISAETISDFRLGFAVDSWDNLSGFLLKRGFKEQEIFLAGLSVKKDRGVGFYDRFRGRIIFPIADVHGRVVGFGGRTMKAEEPAKYLNTPQTAIYNKSAVLYGLSRAKDAVKKNDLAVLVEGYMDVLPSHQAGVTNVVSISGTALTPEQVKLLKRYSANLSLALDINAAGRQTAERNIKMAWQDEMNVKVISVPSGKDPGECIKNNPADWQRAISQAQPAMEYFFERAWQGRPAVQPEEKNRIVKILLPKILQLGSAVEKDYWLHELANRLGSSEPMLREVAAKYGQGPKRQPVAAGPTAMARQPEPSKNYRLLESLLAVVLAWPEHLPLMAEKLSLKLLSDQAALSLYKNLILFYTKNINSLKDLSVDKSERDLFDLFKEWLSDNNAAEATIEALASSFLLSQKDFVGLTSAEAKAEINSLIKTLKIDYLNGKISSLKLSLAQAEKQGESERAQVIYAELNDLVRERAGL